MREACVLFNFILIIGIALAYIFGYERGFKEGRTSKDAEPNKQR